jgi:hypothetical protein
MISVRRALPGEKTIVGMSIAGWVLEMDGEAQWYGPLKEMLGFMKFY